jgi:hypothetical protein
MSTFKNLQPGQVLSETSFYKVEKIVGSQAQFKAEDGQSVVLNEGYINSFLISGDNYSKEEAVTRTEMSEILLKNPFRAMTANFNKQVKDTDIIKEIQEAYENATPKDFASKMKTAVKNGMAGEERTMKGYHFGSQDDFGRVHFIDMGIDRDFSKTTYDTRQRLLDTRTLNWLIVNDTKYTIKK